MRMLAMRALVVAVLTAAASACTEPDDPIARARARWASRGPSNYIFTMRITTDRDDIPAWVTVMVVHDSVISRTDAATTRAIAPALNPLFPTVSGLFDRIEERRRVRTVGDTLAPILEFDAVYGFPTRIQFLGLVHDFGFTLRDLGEFGIVR